MEVKKLINKSINKRQKEQSQNNLVGKTPTRNRWGEIPIPSLDFEKLQKYLGMYIHHNGKISLPREDWKIKLERLQTCQLNPIQKVQVIRQSICFFILFQLRLSDHGLEEAQKLNPLFWGAIKRILHPPSWMLSDWLHHCHGGNVPDLFVVTMILWKKASAKLKVAPDPISQFIGDQINPINGERLRRLKIGDIKSGKSNIQQKREERLCKQNNGHSITNLRTCGRIIDVCQHDKIESE